MQFKFAGGTLKMSWNSKRVWVPEPFGGIELNDANVKLLPYSLGLGVRGIPQIWDIETLEIIRWSFAKKHYIGLRAQGSKVWCWFYSASEHPIIFDTLKNQGAKVIEEKISYANVSPLYGFTGAVLSLAVYSVALLLLIFIPGLLAIINAIFPFPFFLVGIVIATVACVGASIPVIISGLQARRKIINK